MCYVIAMPFSVGTFHYKYSRVVSVDDDAKRNNRRRRINNKKV